MNCRHSYQLIDAGTYVVGSRLGCRQHQFRALSLSIKGLYLLNMYIVYREVGGQNNAYAAEEADVGNGRTQPEEEFSGGNEPFGCLDPQFFGPV
jgi:hypothetical protein